MFEGRDNEQKQLNELYYNGNFECVVLDGRLRVGKTSLLSEFIKDKKFVYFTAQETVSRENLHYMANCVEKLSNEFGIQMDENISSYKELFKHVFYLAQLERFVFIIDDYEFLVASHEGVSGLICSCIDKLSAGSKLMLVISGSSAPVMEREIFSKGGPFHGRFTARIDLKPFTFFETKRYFNKFAPLDLAVLYGVTGGTPGYLELMDPNVPLDANIQMAFFDMSSPLLGEPADILRHEAHNPIYYNAVLRAIAAGCTKQTDIAEATGLEKNACAECLSHLIAFGHVITHMPLAENSKKKAEYDIVDSMLRFWYRFVPDNLSLIQNSMAGTVWRGVSREIPDFMHRVFEDICMQWVILRNDEGQLPVKFTEIGRWWGADRAHKDGIVIPIIARLGDSHVLFCDCIWSDEPVDIDALESLAERSGSFKYPNKYMFLFSNSGFTDECLIMAENDGANLVAFE